MIENKPITILLVDDDEEIRSMYADIFKNKGFKVLEANDGVEGLDIATKEQKIDLIFTGIIMPRMDGFQLIQSLKEYTETAEIPVVVNSHLGREEDRKKMLELGAKDFIIQGVTSPNDVLMRIVQVIGQGEYLIAIDPLELDGMKFIEDNKLSANFKCPQCARALAFKLKYHKDNSFRAWVVCPNCQEN